MSFSRPIQWYHSHVDPIWPDGNLIILLAPFCEILTITIKSSNFVRGQ